MAFKKEVSKQTEKLTYGEILDRYVILSNIKNLPGEKLGFARSKNLISLRKFYQENSSNSRIPLTSEFEIYQKEINQLREKHILTDAEGKTVFTEGVPLVDVGNVNFVKESNNLKIIHSAAITEREDDIKAFNEFRDTEVPENDLLKIHEVKMSDATGLTQEQIDAVYWFVKE